MALLYAYGELEQKDEAAFTDHLKTCAKCQGIIRSCALATAALQPLKAPEVIIPVAAVQPQEGQKSHNSFWDFLPALSLRRLVPAAAMAIVLAVLGVTAYKFADINRPAQNVVEGAYFSNFYAEISGIETELDNWFADFETL